MKKWSNLFPKLQQFDCKSYFGYVHTHSKRERKHNMNEICSNLDMEGGI
jgi:hypothetical protein